MVLKGGALSYSPWKNTTTEKGWGKMQKRKKGTKIISIILLAILLVSVLFPKTGSAAYLQLDETGYYYTGTSVSNGHYANNDDIWNMKMDGKDVFCIDSGARADSSDGYYAEEYFHAEKDRLSKIAYYGFTNTNQTYTDFAVTQLMIWESFGDSLEWTSVPNYWDRKHQINLKIQKHNTQPSWHNQEITLIEGQELVLDDTNNVTDWLNLVSNTANISVQKEGTKLRLKAERSAASTGALIFTKVPDNVVGASIVYHRANFQSLTDFKLQDRGEAKLNVRVKKLGGVRIMKIDQETKAPLPGATIQFNYGDQERKVVTNANGVAELQGIPEGTIVTASESLAPNGYHNLRARHEITVKPLETVEIILDNAKQKGTVSLAKTGEEFGTAMPNQYYSLQGAVYGVYTSENVRVAELQTSETGVATSQALPLGNYYLQEEVAPAGYLLNTAKIPFKLEYAGQDVAITNVNAAAFDKEQRGEAILIKEDSETGAKPQGMAQLDGAVYELYRTSDDELIDTITIEDGRASVSNLLLDDYYWLEKEAPLGYQLDVEKHHFKLEYDVLSEFATTTVTVKENVIKEQIKVIKIDADTKQPIKRNPAKFKLKDLTTKLYVPVDGKEEFSTDKNGEVTTAPVPFGEYELIETDAPDGYSLCRATEKITMDGSHNGEIVVKITNSEKEKITTLTSTDDASKDFLSNRYKMKEMPQLGDEMDKMALFIGLVLLMAGLTLFWSSKRRKNSKE